MTVRGTVALAAVLAVLIAYLMLGGGSAVTVRDAAAAPLLAAADSDVARIELAAPDQRLTAVRTASGWVDASGRPWPGDVVPDLIHVLQTMHPVMTIDPAPSKPAEYGFDDDAARLEVRDAAGAPLVRLQLGARNPSWTGLYARRDDEPPVVLLGGVLSWELDKLRAAAPGSKS